MNKKKAKEKIIETTIQMIEKKGYNKISTNHIAEQAEVSIGTLYYHFENGKPDIIKEIIKGGYAEFLDESNLRSLATDTLPHFLQRFLGKYLEQHKKHKTLLIALESAFLSNKQIFQDFEYIKSELKLVPIVSSVLKQFGYLDKESLEETSKFLLYLVDSIIHHQVIYGEYVLKDEELVTNLTNMILKFLSFNPEKNV